MKYENIRKKAILDLETMALFQFGIKLSQECKIFLKLTKKRVLYFVINFFLTQIVVG